jgi:hypothetical protein
MVFRGYIKSFVLAGALLTLAGPADAATGAKLYCCTDAAGKYVCGDILPQVCYGRAYRELGSDGRLLREIGPPMTAEQRAQRDAEEEEHRQAAIVQKEQHLKDQALLDTYANLDDIEAMRKRALNDANKSISDAEAQIAEIKAQRKKFEDEAEFYKTKTMPPEVEKGLSNTELAIKSQEAIIEAKKKEMTTLQAKFDGEREHFLDLQRRNNIAPKLPPNAVIRPH